MPPVTNAQLADRINILSENVCTAIENVKELNKGFISFQLDYERRHAELVAKLMKQETEFNAQRDTMQVELKAQRESIQTHKDSLVSLKNIVEQQAKEIGDLKDTVKALQVSVISLQGSVNKIISGAGKLFWTVFVPLFLGIISFIYGLLTHTIVITFPK